MNKGGSYIFLACCAFVIIFLCRDINGHFWVTLWVIELLWGHEFFNAMKHVLDSKLNLGLISTLLG